MHERMLARALPYTLAEYTMKRIVLMGLSAAIGIALLTTTTRHLRADTPQVPDGGTCNYSAYTCTYPNGGYWDGCDPAGGSGPTTTEIARALCKTYHVS